MEQSEKALEILQAAIQMEKDGREFYLNAAERSQTSIARNLFQVLAEEEIGHQKAISTIFDAVSAHSQWPDEEIALVHDGNAENVFSAAMKNPEQLAQKPEDDLQAVGIALEMEERSFKLYMGRAGEATAEAEIKFYQALAHEERKHITSLRETEEYLTDTEGWFMKKQHITLDGA